MLSYSFFFGSVNSPPLISITRKKKKEEMKPEFPNGFDIFHLWNKMLNTSNINHLQFTTYLSTKSTERIKRNSLVQSTNQLKTTQTKTSRQLQ